MSDSSSAFLAFSVFLQVFPSAIPAQWWAGLWMQFLRSAQCSSGHQEPQIRSIFPGLCTGRWPNLAELVHCPFSIVTDSPMVSLGRSPEGLWLCLESSTAGQGRASFHTERPQQIKAPTPFPVLSGATWVHMCTHSSCVLGALSKGQEAFPYHTTYLKHNRMVQGPLLLRGLWTMELFKNSSIPINLTALKP